MKKDPWMDNEFRWGYMRAYYTTLSIFAYDFTWQESRGYKGREQFNELDSLKKLK